MVLGRIAGLPQDRLNDLAWNGPVETIVEAVDGLTPQSSLSRLLIGHNRATQPPSRLERPC